MKKIFSGIFILMIVFLFACTKGREMKTDSGFKYILYTESVGAKAEVGNYITMIMVYRNSKDSILFDSRENGQPIRFRLEKIPFRGSYEEGLTYLSEGDSATIFVPADSLFNYLYKSRGEENVTQEKTGLIQGSLLKFDLKVLKIQTEIEAEEEMQIEFSRMEKQERIDLNEYIHTNSITVKPDTSGYYLTFIEKGKGPSIDSGNVVTIDYEARLLNDSVYDGTKLTGNSYIFISGAEHVIAGWEMAFKKCNEGDKINLVVPSRLAYGEDGIRDPGNGTYIVPPYSSLVFDIEIKKVEVAPAVSRK